MRLSRLSFASSASSTMAWKLSGASLAISGFESQFTPTPRVVHALAHKSGDQVEAELRLVRHDDSINMCHLFLRFRVDLVVVDVRSHPQRCRSCSSSWVLVRPQTARRYSRGL